MALIDHAVKLVTLFGVGTRDAVVYLIAVFDTILFLHSDEVKSTF